MRVVRATAARAAAHREAWHLPAGVLAADWVVDSGDMLGTWTHEPRFVVLPGQQEQIAPAIMGVPPHSVDWVYCRHRYDGPSTQLWVLGLLVLSRAASDPVVVLPTRLLASADAASAHGELPGWQRRTLVQSLTANSHDWLAGAAAPTRFAAVQPFLLAAARGLYAEACGDVVDARDALLARYILRRTLPSTYTLLTASLDCLQAADALYDANLDREAVDLLTRGGEA